MQEKELNLIRPRIKPKAWRDIKGVTNYTLIETDQKLPLDILENTKMAIRSAKCET